MHEERLFLKLTFPLFPKKNNVKNNHKIKESLLNKSGEYESYEHTCYEMKFISHIFSSACQSDNNKTVCNTINRI